MTNEVQQNGRNEFHAGVRLQHSYESESYHYISWHIQNPVKHVRWCFLQKFLPKYFIPAFLQNTFGLLSSMVTTSHLHINLLFKSIHPTFYWEWWFSGNSSNEIYWSSHQTCSVKNGVLKNFANFTRKHLCWSLFLILKRDSNTSVFLWNLRKFKNTYFEEHLRTTASEYSRH